MNKKENKKAAAVNPYLFDEIAHYKPENGKDFWDGTKVDLPLPDEAFPLIMDVTAIPVLHPKLDPVEILKIYYSEPTTFRNPTDLKITDINHGLFSSLCIMPQEIDSKPAADDFCETVKNNKPL
ncbi:hypothetical protein [uncultured Chryseobacterium sp.]|uniref:hypothetical protein n=1 Tax=uncultured Chryseobacterium sp. TaxID=259322 RepID=UPI0025D85D13|nr:hypothetical protein [uncultured Chryseobacterium sp.]